MSGHAGLNYPRVDVLSSPVDLLSASSVVIYEKMRLRLYCYSDIKLNVGFHVERSQPRLNTV